MPVHVPVKRFLAAVRHLDRPLGSKRQQAGMDLHADILARAEGATHTREMQAHAFRWEIEAGRQLFEIRMEPLRGDEEVDAAIGGGNGETRFRAERRLVLHTGLVHAFDPDVGGRVGVAVDDREGPHDIAVGMDGGRRRFERPLHVGDRGDDLVVDGDLLQRGPGQFRILRGDDRDGLAGVAHDIHGQHRLGPDVASEGLHARHIGVGQPGAHAWCLESGRRVDRNDPGMWMRAAQGRAPEHPVAAEVARVLELPLHLGDAVHPSDRLANAALSTDVDAHAQIMVASLRFTSCPSWTTGFPSTKRCCTGPGLQKTRAATGSASAPRCASPSIGKSAMSARLPTWIEPTSSRPRHAAPPRVATRNASRAVIAAGPLRPLVVSSACRTSASRLPLSFEAEPSTARPTATPASSISLAGANPDPSRMFEVGHQATAVPVAPRRPISASLTCAQWASQTSEPRKPRSSSSSSGRRLKVAWQYASSSSVSAICVCRRTLWRRASAADSRISRSETEKGEHGPTAIRRIEPGEGSWNRWIASSVAARMVSMSSTTRSGGRPPLAWPTSIDPRQGWNRTPSCSATSISASSKPMTPEGKT